VEKAWNSPEATIIPLDLLSLVFFIPDPYLYNQEDRPLSHLTEIKVSI
jgi:hypothetical protein